MERLKGEEGQEVHPRSGDTSVTVWKTVSSLV